MFERKLTLTRYDVTYSDMSSAYGDVVQKYNHLYLERPCPRNRHRGIIGNYDLCLPPSIDRLLSEAVIPARSYYKAIQRDPNLLRVVSREEDWMLRPYLLRPIIASLYEGHAEQEPIYACIPVQPGFSTIFALMGERVVAADFTSMALLCLPFSRYKKDYLTDIATVACVFQMYLNPKSIRNLTKQENRTVLSWFATFPETIRILGEHSMNFAKFRRLFIERCTGVALEYQAWEIGALLDTIKPLCEGGILDV